MLHFQYLSSRWDHSGQFPPHVLKNLWPCGVLIISGDGYPFKFYFVLYLHPARFRVYSWLCAKGSLLQGKGMWCFESNLSWSQVKGKWLLTEISFWLLSFWIFKVLTEWVVCYQKLKPIMQKGIKAFVSQYSFRIYYVLHLSLGDFFVCFRHYSIILLFIRISQKI